MIFPVKTRNRIKEGIPLTSLIDIVFLLLIYFLLTANFIAEEGIKVNLPRTGASSPVVKAEIVVWVDSRGRTFIEDREVAPAALFSLLRKEIGSDRDRLVVIKADRDVILKAAVEVMDVAKAAGAARLSLATERKF